MRSSCQTGNEMSNVMSDLYGSVRYPEWTNTICKQNFSLRKACNGLMVIISDETSPPAVTNLCVKVCIMIVSL